MRAQSTYLLFFAAAAACSGRAPEDDASASETGSGGSTASGGTGDDISFSGGTSSGGTDPDPTGSEVSPEVVASHRQVLAVGDTTACALDQEGAVVCWGFDVIEQPVRSGYVDISAYEDVFCALHAAGEIDCWGQFGEPMGAPLVNGPYQRVVVGPFGVCAQPTTGTAECGWGAEFAGVNQALVDVCVGSRHVCGLDAAGSVVCWGEVPEGSPSTGTFDDIECSRSGVCVLSSGTVTCWGPETSQVDTIAQEAGTVEALTLYDNEECVLAEGGEAFCGAIPVTNIGDPSDFLFAEISVGDNPSCGVVTDGTVYCWGASSNALSPPEGLVVLGF